VPTERFLTSRTGKSEVRKGEKGERGVGLVRPYRGKTKFGGGQKGWGGTVWEKKSKAGSERRTGLN